MRSHSVCANEDRERYRSARRRGIGADADTGCTSNPHARRRLAPFIDVGNDTAADRAVVGATWRATSRHRNQ